VCDRWWQRPLFSLTHPPLFLDMRAVARGHLVCRGISFDLPPLLPPVRTSAFFTLPPSPCNKAVEDPRVRPVLSACVFSLPPRSQSSFQRPEPFLALSACGIGLGLFIIVGRVKPVPCSPPFCRCPSCALATDPMHLRG